MAQAVETALRAGTRQTCDLPHVCSTLGLSEGTIRSLAKRGIMPTIRAGRRLLIPLWWVDDVLAGRRDLATPYTPNHANDR